VKSQQQRPTHPEHRLARDQPTRYDGRFEIAAELARFVAKPALRSCRPIFRNSATEHQKTGAVHVIEVHNNPLPRTKAQGHLRAARVHEGWACLAGSRSWSARQHHRLYDLHRLRRDFRWSRAGVRNCPRAGRTVHNTRRRASWWRTLAQVREIATVHWGIGFLGLGMTAFVVAGSISREMAQVPLSRS